MDDETVKAVRRSTLRLARRLRGSRSAGALSPAKVGVLGYLSRHGASSPGEIAAADAQRPQALTKVFAELEADGLISRAPNEHDGRSVVLDLTARGTAALEADMRERDEWLAGALETLGETERGVLRLAAPLLDRLSDHPAVANEDS
ncbi:MarR family winged helix-turn-helix transcriptional regulator [Amycolatopsis australiensis]|uniref:DNA-binding transcriptional regulator, MarR family n=1 Tax=Amycolatopsis australiensis TaxID=546364 RepID=A0A1K1R6E2_9PSEU|nr:MarR family transcriptional regulator [Amycolatopsis australiensis]SFW67481.1 DNA-binding transcriptional regulator, MarR family [Amycolatopsis australiensis]